MTKLVPSLMSFWHVFFLTYIFWLLNLYFKRNESETCCNLWSNIPSAECTYQNKKIMKNLIFTCTFTSKLYPYILRHYFTCYREDGCDDEMGTIWKKLIVASFKVLYHHFPIGTETNHEKIRMVDFQALKRKWNPRKVKHENHSFNNDIPHASSSYT